MVDTVGTKGYGDTSVADVIAAAGVSRATFYEQFSSKSACFLAAFDAAAATLAANVAEAMLAPGTPTERFDLVFGRYLDSLAEMPGQARVFLIEVYAAGPAAISRRTALQREIAATLADILGARSPDDLFACQALVAAISTLVTQPLVDGDVAALRALRGPVTALVARIADRPEATAAGKTAPAGPPRAGSVDPVDPVEALDRISYLLDRGRVVTPVARVPARGRRDPRHPGARAPRAARVGPPHRPARHRHEHGGGDQPGARRRGTRPASPSSRSRRSSPLGRRARRSAPRSRATATATPPGPTAARRSRRWPAPPRRSATSTWC